VIRKAAVEDLPLLLELERVCFKDTRYSREQIEWLLKGENEATYLYFHNSDAIGSLMLSLQGDSGRIISVGVHPDWRGRGVARELMDVAEKWFLDSGAHKVDLEVGVNNKEALNLYSSLGYEVVRVLKEYYPEKEDAFHLRKKLEV
jgi:ribosomal-protein-alanine N-acetyltransferase